MRALHPLLFPLVSQVGAVSEAVRGQDVQCLEAVTRYFHQLRFKSPELHLLNVITATAAQLKRLDMVELLLRVYCKTNKEKVDALNSSKALIYAVKNQDLPMVQFILSHPVQINMYVII